MRAKSSPTSWHSLNKMNQIPKPLIIIAEDDKDLATLIATQLEVAGMQSQIYHEASHVQRFLKTNFANLILLDVHLPDNTGFNLMTELRKNGNETPVVFLTGENDEVKKVKTYAEHFGLNSQEQLLNEIHDLRRETLISRLSS